MQVPARTDRFLGRDRSALTGVPLQGSAARGLALGEGRSGNGAAELRRATLQSGPARPAGPGMRAHGDPRRYSSMLAPNCVGVGSCSCGMTMLALIRIRSLRLEM